MQNLNKIFIHAPVDFRFSFYEKAADFAAKTSNRTSE
jgi:hypothetical protein